MSRDQGLSIFDEEPETAETDLEADGTDADVTDEAAAETKSTPARPPR
jgi:hypothetical protein